MRLSYSERIKHCKNPLAKKLLSLLDVKKTNLALSADVTSATELLALADLIGPEICVLKTHIDIIEDFTPALVLELQKLAEKHQFLIFEDRKFADIGNTVRQQYQNGIYKISEWADIINAHTLPGPGVISGLRGVGVENSRGLLLLAQMSSAENLFTPEYTQKTLELAEKFADFVIGFVAQKKLDENPGWIYFTPGIQFSQKEDTHGQQYNTPEKAILENHTDIIIVGRGIIHSANPLESAKQYRAAGWNSYACAIIPT